MIHPFTQGHLLSMVAPATILTGIGWVDFDSRSSSFFRFGEQLVKKSRPCRVLNAFGKTMVMGHSIHLQVFDADDPVGIDNFAAFLVREVLPPEANAFMDTGDGFTVFPSFRCTLSKLGMFALDFCQSLLFLAKEPWIVLNSL